MLTQQGYDKARVWEGEYAFSGMLGIYFLRADLATLKELTRLPQTLERLGLDFAAVALYQSLGCAEQIPLDLKQGKDEKQLYDFVDAWRNQGDEGKLAD